MIVHGRQDFLISELQSIRLSAALVDAHAPVDLHLVEGEMAHNFDGYGTDSLTAAGVDLVDSVLANAMASSASAVDPIDHVLLIGDGGHLGDDHNPVGRNRMAHAIIRLLALEYRISGNSVESFE